MSVPGHAHDLFISYARADVRWVEEFKRAFCQEFLEREGKPVSIWQDSTDLRGGSEWSSELEEALKSAAALLAIVSPPYGASDWCTEERRFLLEHYGGLAGLKVDAIYRLLKVTKLPMKYPPFRELQDVARFYHEGGKEAEAFREDSHEFSVAVAKAVTAVRELFRLMGNGQTRVFVARGPIELKAQRDQLEAELTGRGYQVRPDFALSADQGPEVLEKELESCSHAIFLLGGKHDEFLEEQFQRAIALKKPCFTWIHPRLVENAAARQKTFLEQLAKRGDLPTGSETLGGQSITALLQQLEPKLKGEAAASLAGVSKDKPNVYLIFDATLAGEAEAASHIHGILAERQLQVIEYRKHEEHEGLMRACDGAVLLRAAKGDPDWWLKLFAQEVVDGRWIKSKALVVADSARLKVTTGDVAVIEYSQPLPSRSLDSFVDKLLRSRGAHASR